MTSARSWATFLARSATMVVVVMTRTGAVAEATPWMKTWMRISEATKMEAAKIMWYLWRFCLMNMGYIPSCPLSTHE